MFVVVKTLPVVSVRVEFTCKQSVNVPAGTLRVTLNAAMVLMVALTPIDGSAGIATQDLPTEKVAGNSTLLYAPKVSTQAPAASNSNVPVLVGKGTPPTV